MFWTDKNTQGGQMVAMQTTFDDFKDLHILAYIGDDKWLTISLLDGNPSLPTTKPELIERLNNNRAVPVPKMVYSHTMPTLPENRAMLPIVTIGGLRANPR